MDNNATANGSRHSVIQIAERENARLSPLITTDLSELLAQLVQPAIDSDPFLHPAELFCHVQYRVKMNNVARCVRVWPDSLSEVCVAIPAAAKTKRDNSGVTQR